MGVLKSEKMNRAARIYSLALLFFCLVCILLTVQLYSLKTAALWLIAVPVWFFMIFGLLRGSYRKSAYILGLCVIVWFVLTRVLQGDYTLKKSFDFSIDFCMIYGFAFAFASVTQDGERRRLFDVAAFAVVAFFAVIAWIGVICIFLGGHVQLSDNYILAHFNGAMLEILGQNPNDGALYLMLALLLASYLLFEYKKPLCYVFCSVAIVGLFFAMVLSNCRGATYSLIASSVPVIGIFASPYIKKHAVRYRTLVVIVVCLLGLLLTIAAFKEGRILFNALYSAELEYETAVSAESAESIADNEDLLSKRDLSTGLNGRDVVYKNVLHYMIDHPMNLLRGTNERMVTLMTTNSGENGQYMTHLHSSYLQALALLGLPGLLLVMAICVLLLVASVRILFSKSIEVAGKLLPVILLSLIVDSLIYTCIFVPYATLASSTINNFLFFLCAGYVIELGGKKDALS